MISNAMLKLLGPLDFDKLDIQSELDKGTIFTFYIHDHLYGKKL